MIISVYVPRTPPPFLQCWIPQCHCHILGGLMNVILRPPTLEPCNCVLNSFGAITWLMLLLIPSVSANLLACQCGKWLDAKGTGAIRLSIYSGSLTFSLESSFGFIFFLFILWVICLAAGSVCFSIAPQMFMQMNCILSCVFVCSVARQFSRERWMDDAGKSQHTR